MIEVTGLNQVKEVVQEYTQSLRTMKSLFERIEEELEAIASESISSQKSASTGTSYKSLSDVTVERTGKNKNKALWSRNGSTNRIIKFDNLSEQTALTSVSLPYAGVHQFGNSNNTFYNRPAPIPARPYLPLTSNGEFTKEFQNKLSEITQTWLTEQVNRRGRRL